MRLLFKGSPGLSLGLLSAVGVGQAAFGAALTLAVAVAFDAALTPEPSSSSFRWLMFAFLFLAGLRHQLRILERSVSERIGQNHVHALRIELWDHLAKMATDTIRGQRRGAVVLRFVGDLTAIKNWIGRGLCGGMVALLSLFGGLAALFWLDSRIASVVTGLLTLLAAYQAYANGQLRREVQRLRRLRGHLSTDILERVDALRSIQAFNQVDRERRRISRRSRDVAESSVAVARASGAMAGGADAAGVLMIVATLATASFLTTTGTDSSAAPSAGSLAAGLVLIRFLAAPLRRLVRTFELYQRAAVAQEKIDRFLSLPTMADRRRRRPPKDGLGALKIRDLTVDGVFERLEASAKGGSVIRLAGNNGAGKSTLLRLIAGLDQPDAGQRVIDGRLLERATLFDVREVCGMVGADLPLMRGSVKRNLLYRWPGAPRQELERVIRLCGLQQLLAELPGGIRFRLSDGASNLSDGQRQRLAIARALVGQPRLLILDEANRHLDDDGIEMLHRVIAGHQGSVLFVWHGNGAPPHDALWRIQNGRLSVHQDDASLHQQVPGQTGARLLRGVS